MTRDPLPDPLSGQQVWETIHDAQAHPASRPEDGAENRPGQSVATRAFPANPDPHGRDFVAGDVHGCFETLASALEQLRFDQTRDRLFGVGDLINRGPHSDRALEWLRTRFTGVTRGNHEDMFLDWLQAGRTDTPPDYALWCFTLDDTQRNEWAQAIAAMPLAITVATAHGAVGITHAEAAWPDWTKALDALERRDVDSVNIALYGFGVGRDTHRATAKEAVHGVRMTVHGHAVGPVRTIGNRWYIDTGAGFEHANRLTILEITRRVPHVWTFSVIDTDGDPRP